MRGPGVTQGYDHDPAATRRATHDGWLFTGDLAKRSRLGLIAFVTRKKDVIKHGGFSVFPAEVEAQLVEHPAVAEAVVFGAPHPSKGAIPVAVVVLAPGAKATVRDLLEWARENIAPFKAPRAIVLALRAEIPRNDNAKVIKDRARERFLPLLERQLQSRS
jgi:acyl-CoA synthetase (AMP-forming)/AMP-acid ligase II